MENSQTAFPSDEHLLPHLEAEREQHRMNLRAADGLEGDEEVALRLWASGLWVGCPMRRNKSNAAAQPEKTLGFPPALPWALSPALHYHQHDRKQHHWHRHQHYNCGS